MEPVGQPATARCVAGLFCCRADLGIGGERVKRIVFMVSAVALMEVWLLVAAVMTVMVMTTAATADTALAARRTPLIGGPPPGDGSSNQNYGSNPGTDDRTRPTTGGIRYAETCDKPASFCQQP